MDITETNISDLPHVVDLVKRVATSHIFPHFNEEGRETFSSSVLPDLVSIFDKPTVISLKITAEDNVIGFGAIRDNNYITHLFVDSHYQGKKLGKKLLKALLEKAETKVVALRSSVSAVPFYESQGFIVTDKESEFKGIRFVPMRWDAKQ